MNLRNFLHHGGLAADFLRFWDSPVDNATDWAEQYELVSERDLRRVTTHDLPSMFT